MSFGTGAGKGPLPRHVDGDKWRSNYERIFGKSDDKRVESVIDPDQTNTEDAEPEDGNGG